jgi:hypothetical protein
MRRGQPLIIMQRKTYVTYDFGSSAKKEKAI